MRGEGGGLSTHRQHKGLEASPCPDLRLGEGACGQVGLGAGAPILRGEVVRGDLAVQHLQEVGADKLDLGKTARNDSDQ